MLYIINCKGTAKLTENGSIEIINNCNIQYSNHNYHKKEIIWYKIRNTPKIQNFKKFIIYTDGL